MVDRTSPRGRVSIWARPGSSQDRLAWDRWRQRWVVSCRAAPVKGEANEALALLLSGWLGVSRESVRWKKVSKFPAKTLEVDGLTDLEIERRLRLVAEATLVQDVGETKAT